MNDDLNSRLTDRVEAASPLVPPPYDAVVTRFTRGRRRRRTLVAAGSSLAVVAVVTAAVWAGSGNNQSGHPPVTSPTPTDTPGVVEPARPDPTYTWSDEPSRVVLRFPERDVYLKPWSYCWSGPGGSGVCADGSPGMAGDLPDVGTPDAVDFWFGLPGWRFTATFRQLGVDCPRSETARVTSTGDQTFHLEPAGLAGRYQVDVFGRGDKGDVAASFVWTTPTDGPIDPPSAYLALLSDAGGDFHTYDAELSVSDLATQPRSASASIKVTAANGESLVVAPRFEERSGCYERGSAFFRSPPGSTQNATRLGPAPFTYEVTLTLDGKEYVGTAVWPRDEDHQESPNTPLAFNPPLPAYTG